MKLIVPHIPKCAGTFLRDMLTGENLDYPILWFDESEESVDDFLDRCILNIDIYDDIVMGGHVTMRLFERVISQSAAKDIVTLIVLRDPFDRFCSHYEYHLRKPFVDLTDEYTGPLDDELYLTGAYKSNLAIINRDIYSYYIGTGPYQQRDPRGFLHTMYTYKSVATTITGLLPTVKVLLNSLGSDSQFTSFEPLCQLASVLPEFGLIRVNKNPKVSNGIYADTYSAEHARKREMFDVDYAIYDYVLSQEALLFSDENE